MFEEIILLREEIILPRERERESIFFPFYPYPLRKKCGQLLIRRILVLLFSFEVLLKKLSKEKLQQKGKKK
jgi:hypothetical protein